MNSRGFSLAVAAFFVTQMAFARFVLIKNEDNEHVFTTPKQVPISEKGLVEYVDFMTKGKALTHIFFCACGQRASFDSESWEPIWYGFDEKDYGNMTNYLWKMNAKRFKDMGVDPYRVMIRRARDNGVSPWMSMRMNDIHFVTSDKLSRTTRFWRDHPEYRVYPDLVPLGSKNPLTDFTLDFANRRVRDYNFAMARELLTRYDCDGLELDWMRCSPCLTPETARREAYLLTEFVRRVRKAADRAAADRDHPVGLSVRVPSIRKDRESLGYELEKWVSERLVDIVVLSGESAGFVDYDVRAEVTALKRLNASVVIVPAIDRFQCNDESFPMHGDLAAYRGWADSMLSRGVDGLYLFNLEYSALDAQRGVYAGALAPGRVGRGSRRYLATCNDVENKILKPKVKSFLPIPVSKSVEIPVVAGGSLPERTVEVVLGFDSEDVPATFTVMLNGVLSVSSERQCDMDQYAGAKRWRFLRTLSARRWLFPRNAFRTGANSIAFRATDSNARIVWAEIALDDPQKKGKTVK